MRHDRDDLQHGQAHRHKDVDDVLFQAKPCRAAHADRYEHQRNKADREHICQRPAVPAGQSVDQKAHRHGEVGLDGQCFDQVVAEIYADHKISPGDQRAHDRERHPRKLKVVKDLQRQQDDKEREQEESSQFDQGHVRESPLGLGGKSARLRVAGDPASAQRALRFVAPHLDPAFGTILHHRTSFSGFRSKSLLSRTTSIPMSTISRKKERITGCWMKAEATPNTSSSL